MYQLIQLSMPKINFHYWCNYFVPKFKDLWSVYFLFIRLSYIQLPDLKYMAIVWIADVSTRLLEFVSSFVAQVQHIEMRCVNVTEN